MGFEREGFAPPRSLEDQFLWTGQVWLAMFFGAAGYAKLTEPANNLVALLGWPAHAAPPLVQGLGAAEVAVALGMIRSSPQTVVPALVETFLKDEYPDARSAAMVSPMPAHTR